MHYLSKSTGCAEATVPAEPLAPFFVPFSALAVGEVGNLLVCGKTMAQSFVANAATRLHPVEWSTGAAAGVAAALMASGSVGGAQPSTADVLASNALLAQLRDAISSRHAPLEWQACPKALNTQPALVQKCFTCE